MQRKKHIEFWFAVGSTYTYLSAMRTENACRQNGISISWHPFNVRKIMLETDNFPFPASKPDKVNYMWRDLERRAEHYGHPVRLPVEYPLEHFERANRIAVIAARDGWCGEYLAETYRNWFQRGLTAGAKANLRATLASLNKPYDSVLCESEGDAACSGLEGNTDEARQRGVFGSPSFFVCDELFWGDDRLEDAIRYCDSQCMPSNQSDKA